MPSIDYRTRVYEKYATRFKGMSLSFDAAAADLWGKAYDHYFRDWLPEDRNAAIVDLACGDGKLLHFFKQRGYSNLAGVDISPEQAALARQVVAGVELGTVASFLDRGECRFDLITGLDIIEHLSKDEAIEFLESCYRALKPGGRLILQTPNADSPFLGSVRYGDFTHEILFTPRLLADLLGLVGFEDAQPREQGPQLRGYSLKSTVRALIWRGIRSLIRLWNLVETGSGGSGVFTRVFVIMARKPTASPAAGHPGQQPQASVADK